MGDAANNASGVSTRTLVAVSLTAFVLGCVATGLAVVYLTKKNRSYMRPRSRTSPVVLDGDEDFVNDMIAALWPSIDIAGSEEMRKHMEPNFKQLPPPLSSIRFTSFTLGSKPLQASNVQLRKHDGVIHVNADVDWETDDCNVQLEGDFIKASGITAVTLTGRLSLVFTPQDKVPVLAACQVAFVSQPIMQVKFTGLAQQVTNIDLLRPSVLRIIEDCLADILVLPRRQVLRFDPTISFLKVHYRPPAVLRVSLMDGRGFSGDEFGLLPSVYTQVAFGPGKPWQSSTAQHTKRPEWNETVDFVFCDRDQELVVSTWLENEGALALDADEAIGHASASVGTILDKRRSRARLALVDDDGKLTGASVVVGVQLIPFTTDLRSLSPTTSTPKAHSLVGIIDIVIARAYRIPGDRSTAASFVKVDWGPHHFRTDPVTIIDADKDPLNPHYDSFYHIALESGFRKHDLVLSVMNGKTNLGKIAIAYQEFYHSADRTITRTDQLPNSDTLLEYRVSLRGVQTPDAVQSTQLPMDISLAQKWVEWMDQTPQCSADDDLMDDANSKKTV